jgi:hypothetical protein
MPVVRVSGRYERPFEVVPSKHSNNILFVADSLGRFGLPFVLHVQESDKANGRGLTRPDGFAATQNGGSLNQYYITNIITSYAQGGDPDGKLNGLIFHYLDFGQSNDSQKAQVARAISVLRTRTKKYIPVGLFTARYLTWGGSAITATQNITDTPERFEVEDYYEGLFGELFDGGTFLNVRKWLNSTRNPRYTASDWDPVFQMSVSDVATTIGQWGYWSGIDKTTPNYPGIRANLNQANFQAYIANAADVSGTTDWHYFVTNGTGDRDIGTVIYRRSGIWVEIADIDPIHHPFEAVPTNDGIVSGPDVDESDVYNMLAYDVVGELDARSWLDEI